MPVTPEQLYEQILVVRSQVGDEAAFRELYALCGPRLLAFAERLSPSGLAADLIQEIWVAIYRGLPALQDAAKFRPWAFRIARDRIFREFRRRKMVFESIEEAHWESPPAEDPQLGMDELHRGLDAISHSHREVLHLRFFEDLSYEEIAGLTGSSVGTIRSRIHYAKRALKIALQSNTP